MASNHPSEPTFSIFVVLATVFVLVLAYVTFPRRDAPNVASSDPPPPAAAPGSSKK